MKPVYHDKSFSDLNDGAICCRNAAVRGPKYSVLMKVGYTISWHQATRSLRASHSYGIQHKNGNHRLFCFALTAKWVASTVR
jgi:hypothetical protein